MTISQTASRMPRFCASVFLPSLILWMNNVNEVNMHHICVLGYLWTPGKVHFFNISNNFKCTRKASFKNSRNYFFKGRTLFQSKHSFFLCFVHTVFQKFLLWLVIFRYDEKSVFDWYMRSAHSSHTICMWIQPGCYFYLMLSCLGSSWIFIKELNENKIVSVGFPKEGHILDKKGKVAVAIVDISHPFPPHKSSLNIF